MTTIVESTLIAVRNDKNQLVGVMERRKEGYEIYVTKEASVKEVEMLFTAKFIAKNDDNFSNMILCKEE